MKIIDNIITKAWEFTHRVKTISDINCHKDYLPQWWCVWWHYYWKETGYQYMEPVRFKTLEEVYDYLIPYWQPEKQSILNYYRKQDQINRKLDEVNTDF